METNYTWIKTHTLMEIIEDTLEKALWTDDWEDGQDQIMFTKWLLQERKGDKNVQLPENPEQ